MSETLNTTLKKAIAIGLITLMFSAVGWVISNTHTLRVELTEVRRIVIDDKDARIVSQNENSDAHKRIEVKLTLFDTKLEELIELRIRLTTVEAAIKAIELKIIELRVDVKENTTQIAKVEASLKSLEVQLVEIRGRITTLENKLIPK